MSRRKYVVEFVPAASEALYARPSASEAGDLPAAGGLPRAEPVAQQRPACHGHCGAYLECFECPHHHEAAP